jgi:hypothetical protein
VDEPVRSRLRAARHRGLTSPDMVSAFLTARTGHRQTANRYPVTKPQDKPQDSERQENRARRQRQDQLPPATGGKRSP